MNSIINQQFGPFTGLFPSIFDDDLFSDFFDNFSTRGLKKIIQRPHDLVNVKDEGGNVVGQKLSLVYTPFTKDQIKVTIDNNLLSVSIGGDEKKEEKKNSQGEIIYKGISTQSTKFSLRLTDAIDKNGIDAKAEDGMLHIYLPFVKEDKSQKQIQVEVK